MKIMNRLCVLILGISFFNQVMSKTEANLDDSSYNLEKALVVAVKENNQDAVRKLLQEGVNPYQYISYAVHNYDDYDSEHTCTILQYAARSGFAEVVKELLKAKPQADDIHEALIGGASNGNAEVVRHLISCEGSQGGVLGFFNDFFNFNRENKKHLDIALMASAEAFPGVTTNNSTGKLYRENIKNYADVILLLIQAGANVNYENEWGQNPLIRILSESIYTEKQRFAREKIVQSLLKAGVNVNHADKRGNLPLIIAIKKHDCDAVQILLKVPGININYVDKDGNTPFIIAVKSIRDSYIVGRKDQYNDCINSQSIVKILLETPGIDVYHANKNGDTAIVLLKSY